MILSETVVATRGPGLHPITRDVARDLPARDGLLTLFVRHTSCSLLIQENADPDVALDLQDWIERLVPDGTHPSQARLRHTLEGPDDMPAHMRAALLPVSLAVPVEGGRPLLGTWQGVFLWEHRARPHRRRVARHFA